MLTLMKKSRNDRVHRLSPMPLSRSKSPKVTFYALKFPDEWQLLVHRPGFVRDRIRGFASKAQAEAWPSTAAGKEWLRTRGYTDERTQ